MKLTPKIDIHTHVVRRPGCPRLGGDYFLTPDQQRWRYNLYGVEKGVQLPIVSPECESDQITNPEALALVHEYPETIGWWFCNVDPRWGDNRPTTDLSHYLRYYYSLGARGIGEVTTNLPFDDPFMENLFFHAEKMNMPILFHMGASGGGDYGIVDDFGLPRLEGALKKFPGLQFIAHSQKWWAEMSGDLKPEERDGYPQGEIAPGGRAIALLREYPNMMAELSAGSGQNAIMRDPDFGYRFLEEFQDKLFFGMDLCAPQQTRELPAFLDAAVENQKISRRCYDKIVRENVLKIVES